MDRYDRHFLILYFQDVFIVELLRSLLADSIEQCKRDIHNAAPPYRKYRMIQLHRLGEWLSDACALRDQVYADGMVPTHCRNLYAAYYLYDRFRSGQEQDLEEAIRNMDLEETRRQLDRMILLEGQSMLKSRVRMARQEQSFAHISAVRRLVTDFLLAADYLREE